MSEPLRETGLKVFATCPPSYGARPRDYLQQLLEVARWCDAAGCEGILVYTDNGIVEPWLVAEQILTHTERLAPLVAVQPVYMHPFTVAKIVSSLAFLHGRPVYLNMVAGGFRNDLIALDDPTPHDERYARLIEYTSVVTSLLGTDGPVTFDGHFYRVKNLRLAPRLDPELMPGVFVSGSSQAGLEAARALNALAVCYPKPAAEYEAISPAPHTVAALGIRVGIVARESAREAWAVAHARFPVDRKGQLTHQLAMKVSDSQWHRQLSELGEMQAGDDQPYWMVPFENYRTFCPYLVGSYERVAEELARYAELGCRTVIVDVPASAAELEHIAVVCTRAMQRVTT